MDEKWEKDGDEHDHEVDDSVSDRDYEPEDSESDASESSDSQLNKIVCGGGPSESGGGPKKRRPRPKKKCPVCGLMNSNISRHMRDLHLQTYKGEGEFECQILSCRSRFASRLGLVRHLRGKSHAGEPEAKAIAASLDRRRKSVPIQESPSFNWEDIMKDFFEFLMGHDGGAHEESMVRDRVHLLRNIIKDCEFENLQSFNIEDYKKKHVQKLQKEKKTPATFISHSNAMTNFLNFAILKKLALSFNVGEALLNLKNRRASYRKFLKKRRQVIRENDRRNALDPIEVDNEEMRKKNCRARGGSEDPRGAPLPHDRRKSTATGRDTTDVEEERRGNVAEEGETSGCVIPEPRPSQPRPELHSEVTSPEKVSDKPQNKENPVQEADVPAYKSRKQFSQEELSEVKCFFAEKINSGERIRLKDAKAALAKGDLPCCAKKNPNKFKTQMFLNDEILEDDNSNQEEDHDDDSVLDAGCKPKDSKSDISESSETELRKSIISISPLLQIKWHQTKDILTGLR
ncbi:uncharacterized protein LOC143453090 [Clavelina lepadiformis]|uniref:uncharacterized protein LOC143453090 n=1 Tax=Clavelina lepadiformis TaxID=159417 RepID=UPI00404191A3